LRRRFPSGGSDGEAAAALADVTETRGVRRRSTTPTDADRRPDRWMVAPLGSPGTDKRSVGTSPL